MELKIVRLSEVNGSHQNKYISSLVCVGLVWSGGKGRTPKGGFLGMWRGGDLRMYERSKPGGIPVLRGEVKK